MLSPLTSFHLSLFLLLRYLGFRALDLSQRRGVCACEDGAGVGGGAGGGAASGIAWGLPMEPQTETGWSSGFLEAECEGARVLPGGNPGLCLEPGPLPLTQGGAGAAGTQQF